MFKLGDQLTVENYAAAAEWCNQGNRYTIKNRQIVEIPAPSPEEQAMDIRSMRDALLSATDKYMLADFPIAEDEREQYRQYRQYLRDIPEKAAFPNVSVLTFEEWQNQF